MKDFFLQSLKQPMGDDLGGEDLDEMMDEMESGGGDDDSDDFA